MQELLDFYNRLTTFEKFSFWASVASFVSLIPLLVSFVRSVSASAPDRVVREFLFAYKSPINYVLSVIIISSFVFLVLQNSRNILSITIITILLVAFIFLLFSFFIRQNKPIMRQIILSHMERAIKKYGSVCSAIKFDVDLIVAINDFSYATGNDIVTLVKQTLKSYEKKYKQRGIDVVSIEIPESDEVLWILPSISVTDAADMADDIRREVKRKLNDIPYYTEAKNFVISKLTNPPLTEEEREGIGTVSAGVAAYTRGVESLLADISSASKESKFRGRNRTIIYQREKPSIVRDH
jgi:GGDEF domain-containing protein